MRACSDVLLSVLTVVATLTGSRVHSANSLSVSELKVHRATAYSLLVEVPCQRLCGRINIRFKFKKTQNALWRPPPDVRIHPSHNDTYRIGSLEPNSLYYIRALLSPPGYFTPILEARTCPERPPPVTALRVAGSGPGWLDVRWTPPRQEACASNFEYATRYGVDGGKLAPLRTYGLVPSEDKGYIRIRPSHPCATWPKEFCLLLVDDVQPGKNHTVEIQVHRLDGKNNENAEVQRIVGFADPRQIASSFDTTKDAPRKRDGPPGEESVRSWFIVTMVALTLFIAVTAIALVLLQSGLQCRLWGRGGPCRRSSDTLPLTGPIARPSARRSLRLCGRDLQWLQPPPPYEDVAYINPAGRDEARGAH